MLVTDIFFIFDCISRLTALAHYFQDHDFSTFHVLASDEQWHFYYGRPLNIYVIDPETKDLRIATLGPRENNHFFYNVPHGNWFKILQCLYKSVGHL